MKKLVFALFALFLVGSVSAQDHEKAYKKAKRLLGTFNLNPSDISKLEQAKEKIDYALTGDLSGLKTPYEPYLVAGNIYNAIANGQIGAAAAAKEVGEGAADKMTPTVQADKPAATAYEALTKAIELATKSSHKKKILTSLLENQNHISNEGIQAYESKSYEDAFNNFTAVIKAHELIKANGGESALDADGAYDKQLYLIGLAGLNAKKYAETKPYLLQLYEKDYDEPLIYSSLYAIGAQEDAAAAYPYLEKGRAKYPDDNALLFEEINHFLRIGKLEELISRLETAIKAEPNNIGLYTTLGNVYDNLYQKASEAGEADNEKKYFDLALANYSSAVEKDPKNVDAAYSMGALYFNKAALVTQEMLKLQDDYTKAGMKKYDAKKAESVELFNQALPHFKKAESLDANDLNTLIALKEIYARIDDIEKSNEFKARLDNVQGGGKNDASYFNE